MFDARSGAQCVDDGPPAGLVEYVPRWVRRACREWGEATDPKQQVSRASVLFLDIVGFSERTTTLASLGAKGAEDISDLLNGVFSHIVGIIDGMQGDIVAFVGDGVVALWDSGDLVNDTRRAVCCGLTLQQSALPTFGIRVSIDCGDVLYCKVGGTAGRWRYMVVGDPIAIVGGANHRAASGETVTGPKARAVLGSSLRGEPMEFDCVKALAVDSVGELAPPAPDPFLSLADLRRLLPTAVVEHGGDLAGRWLAELRNLSIVKVSLNEIDWTADILAVLQDWMSSIESASHHLEGEVAQVQMDDKGVSAAVIFGLPPLAHEDDPFRAVEAALAIHQNLNSRGLRVSIGVTTGLVFCGEFGGDRRREYSATGVAMNLAARLMETAKDGVLCDVATATAVESRVSFSETTRLSLKGWSAPVAAFRLESISAPVRVFAARKTIGRERERRILRDALSRLTRGEGGIVCIEGEAGIGKSTLLLDLVEQARRLNLGALRGQATAIDRATPYYAWRDVLGQLLQTYGPRLGPDLLIDLGAEPQLAEWLPLLEDVTPLGLSPNALTRSMLGSSRASGIEELAVFFLKLATERQPTLLAFDDVHWMDGASMSLARAVAHRLPSLLLIVARRSAGEPGESASAPIEPDVDVALDGLPGERLVEIVCQLLGVSSVPDALARLIVARAAGNPFYCEELTFAMRDTGVLRVEHGECLAAENLNANFAVLPTSIKSIVVARFDTLSLEHRMILKVASALGGGFSPTFLRAVHPSRPTVEKIKDLLDDLVARSMLKSGSVDAEPHYEFRHALFENAIYGSLSFSQRRELHAKAAATIESRPAAVLEPFYAQLARHWELADRPELAVDYLEKAASQALRSYANIDAVGYLLKAIDLSSSGAAQVVSRRLAIWRSMLGDAYHELMDFDNAASNYRTAMKALGCEEPSSPAALARGVLSNALRQVRTRLLPAPRLAGAIADVERVAHIYERLSEEYFYSNNVLPLLHGTLASLNLAERGGAVAETIAGYNALALALGMAGFAGLARRYSRRALHLATKKGDLPDVARAHLVSGVLNYGLGDWEAVRVNSDQSSRLFRQLGDRIRLATAASMAIYTSIIRCELAGATAELNSLNRIIAADPNMSAEVRAWRLCAEASLEVLRGPVARGVLEDLRVVSDAGQAPANLLLCQGVLSVGYLRIGDFNQASRTALAGLRTLEECRVLWAAFGALGAGGVTQALVALWERAEDRKAPDASALRRSAEQAVHRFFRLSKRSPVCWPYALLLRGRAARLTGARGAARRNWLAAANAASRMGMPHLQGLAYFDLGEHGSQGDAERLDHLRSAERIFASHGADYDLARLRELARKLNMELRP